MSTQSTSAVSTATQKPEQRSRLAVGGAPGTPQPLRMLLIHQAFASPSDGGGTRHYEFAQRVVKSGHSFTVVASDLSYLSGTTVTEGPGLCKDERVNGLRVLRAYAYPALHRSFVWRVFSFCTFVASSFITALKDGRVDLVIGTSPPIFQALSAWAVAYLRRRPFLLEIRDLWPEFAVDMGVLTNSALIFLSRRLARFLYARATHIVVNSPAYHDFLITQHVPPLKITLISNGVDPAMFDPHSTGEQVRHKWRCESKFVLSYAGAIGIANDLLTLIQAADRVRERQDIVFLIVGDGKERLSLEAETARRGLKNVIFTGRLSKEEVAQVLAASDACIAILKDIPMFGTTYPNKVFDYMAAGRPTLLAIDGVIRKVIEDSGAGIFVRPGDEAALADAVLRLAADPSSARNMGFRGREYVTKYFNRNQQAAEFVTVSEQLVREWNEEHHRFYRQVGKRTFDLVVAIPLSIVLIPAFALIACLVKLASRGPIFFNQARLGKLGGVFSAYKFRTMLHRDRTKHVEIREGNPEVTAIGQFLRRFKLDELPQLFNVIKGEMSLVGPRPPLPEQIAEYNTETLQRLRVRPGLTGLAQVHGGTRMSWPERWQHDLQYVRELSFSLDLRILMRTILVVALGESRFHAPPSAEER